MDYGFCAVQGAVDFRSHEGHAHLGVHVSTVSSVYMCIYTYIRFIYLLHLLMLISIMFMLIVYLNGLHVRIISRL